MRLEPERGKLRTNQGGHTVDDTEITHRIGDLVTEERELRHKSVGTGLADTDRDRLQAIEVQLDQCWDLLRQRRAREEYGEDPDAARVRSASEVESYQQ